MEFLEGLERERDMYIVPPMYLDDLCELCLCWIRHIARAVQNHHVEHGSFFLWFG